MCTHTPLVLMEGNQLQVNKFKPRLHPICFQTASFAMVC